MKATAVAPANIAFIKYWGKKDEILRLPLNSSISMNLSNAYTTTTVEFSPDYHEDQVHFSPWDRTYKIKRPLDFVGSAGNRIRLHLDKLRTLKGISYGAKIVTSNSFPAGAGIASSASGFAALTVASVAALGLQLSEKELSILARLGSGSACRSIPDGFVVWKDGSSSRTSYAHSLYPPEHWDLRDIVVVIQSTPKEISSTSGMEAARTSPLLAARLTAIPARIEKMKDALANKDIHTFGEVIEEDCLDMHAVMQSQKPPLHYLTDETREIVHAVRRWRKAGLAVYFTIDAGPNMHLICEAKDERKAIKAVKTMRVAKEIIVNKPARGAHLIEEHLF